MKYTTKVEIERARGEVFEQFADSRNYSAWMETLVSMEVIEEGPGEVGIRTQIVHKMGKREVSMLETITEREDPRQLTATYEADGVWNQAINRFEERDGGGTTWVMETEFRCKGVMWFMTRLMPGMFKKQTQKTMEAFKAFAESQATVG